MPTSVSLNPCFEAFLREQVDSGQYNNVSEVVRDALRLLEAQQRQEALKLAGLRRAAKAGFGAIERGEHLVADARDIAAEVARLGGRAAARRKAKR